MNLISITVSLEIFVKHLFVPNFFGFDQFLVVERYRFDTQFSIVFISFSV